MEVSKARLGDEWSITNLERLHRNKAKLRPLNSNGIPQHPPETSQFDFHHVAVLEPHIFAKIAFLAAQCHCAAMNMAELMREVSNLPAEQQKELAGYLLHLRLQHDTAWRSEMTRRIDDRTPANWVDLQDWKKEVGKNGGE